MMTCSLQACGVRFEAEQFLSESSSFHGEVHRLRTDSVAESDKDLTNTVVMLIPVSGAERLSDQFTDAIVFLKSNDVEIERLQTYPNVELISLNFGITREEDLSYASLFPEDLKMLAFKTRVALSIFDGRSTW